MLLKKMSILVQTSGWVALSQGWDHRLLSVHIDLVAYNVFLMLLCEMHYSKTERFFFIYHIHTFPQTQSLLKIGKPYNK